MQGSINFDGTLIGDITGGGGGGGSEVVITPVLTSGTKIADVTVDGEDKDLFAPTPTPPTPATEVSVTQTLESGTKIGSIEVDGESTDLFAPTPTPPTPATEVSITQVLTEGTKIASIEVDGNSTDLFAPSGGGGGGFSITPLSDIMPRDIATLTLNDSILNYDVVMVECCRDTAGTQRGNIWLPTSIIDQVSPYRRYRTICPAGSQNVDGCFDFYFQNNNQIVKSYANQALFYGCYGINF